MRTINDDNGPRARHGKAGRGFIESAAAGSPKISVSFDADTFWWLRATAAERRVSIGSVIRQCVKASLAEVVGLNDHADSPPQEKAAWR